MLITYPQYYSTSYCCDLGVIVMAWPIKVYIQPDLIWSSSSPLPESIEQSLNGEWMFDTGLSLLLFGIIEPDFQRMCNL